MSMRPVTVAPSRMALGGSLTLTLTLKVRVTGSACGSTWRTRPFAVTAGSSVRATMIVGIRRSRPYHLGRHIEYGVPSLLAGHLEDHLSGLHDFPRFRAPGGDRSGDIGLELRVAHPILGDLQLRLGVIHLGLRRAQPLLRLVEQNFRRKSSGQKRFLALERIARLHQFPLRGGKSGPRRPQGVQFILRVEFRQHLIWFDMIADAGRSFDDPPADAKGESRLVFGLNLPGQHHRFAKLAFFGGHRPNRTRLRGFGLCLPLTARKQQGKRR